MIINAKSWLGKRTRLYDDRGQYCHTAIELDTSKKTAKVFTRLEDGRALVHAGQILYKTIDVTGWTFTVFGSPYHIKL